MDDRTDARHTMKWFSAMVLLATATQAAALQAGSPRPFHDRRAVCAALLSTSLFAPLAAVAEETSVFVGRYSDPNHPGGYREISVLPGGVGSYKLANVHGGEGKGEPASYDLPAIIVERKDQQQIIIDFSVPPKNGPRDFAAVYDAKANGIRFVRDGNFWPRQ